MTRTLLFLALVAAFLAAAPLVSAQETKEEEPADGGNAWVDDCPPDMMCAFQSNESGDAPKDDRPTYDGDCGGEVCAYDGGERPRDDATPLGPDGCIECSQGPSRGGDGTCMDGRDEGERCGGADCEYCRTLDGGGSGDAEPVSTEADQADEAKNAVPGVALGALVASAGLLALVLRRRA